MTWVWFILALVIVAAILGFGGIIAVAVDIFRIFFWVLLAIFIIGLITGLTRRRTVA